MTAFVATIGCYALLVLAGLREQGSGWMWLIILVALAIGVKSARESA